MKCTLLFRTNQNSHAYMQVHLTRILKHTLWGSIQVMWVNFTSSSHCFADESWKAKVIMRLVRSFSDPHLMQAIVDADASRDVSATADVCSVPIAQ